MPIFDIRELKRVVRKERIDIAVIAVPAESAHPVLEQVVAAGIKAVLNFSPGTLKAPPGVKLKSVDLTVSLESLSFYLAQGIDTDQSGRDMSPTRKSARLSHVDARRPRSDGGRRRQGRHRPRSRRARRPSACRRPHVG